MAVPIHKPAASVAPKGALGNLPFVFKDTWDVAGVISRGGSFRHKDRVPTKSSRAYDELIRQGAVFLGKSNVADMAFSHECANHVVGATRNPYDLSRTSGGSTGGGAASVSARFAACDWGGDFGGSIRMPAAFCGVAGLRLSSTVWPAKGDHFPEMPEIFDFLLGWGPLAPTTDGIEIIVNAMQALRDGTAHREMSTDNVALYMPDNDSRGHWSTFERDVSGLLGDAGVSFQVDETLPKPGAIDALFNRFLCAHFDAFINTGELPVAEGLPAVFLGLGSRGRFDKRVHHHTGALLAAVAVGHLLYRKHKSRLRREVSTLQRTAEDIWKSGRLLLAPTTTYAAPKLGRGLLHANLVAFAKLGNLTDATALSIPYGRYPNGMPRAIQILGPAGSELSVIALAKKLEHAGARV